MQGQHVVFPPRRSIFSAKSWSQFAAQSKDQGCEACHGDIKWKPGKFDHQQTSFSLAGAHERVPCKDCHSTKKEVSGRPVVFYKPTPKDCVSCHGPKLKN